MNAEEFKQVFLPLHRQLFSIAYRISGTIQDAEDILQEVYLKLWEKRDTIPKDGNLTGFCVTLTRNQCIDHLRRQHIKTVDEEPTDMDAIQEQNVVDKLTEKEEHTNLMAVIDRLPVAQRQVMLMRDIEGINYTEIAQATGFSEINIRVMLSRARKFVKENIKKTS